MTTARKDELHFISASELASATLPKPASEIIGAGQIAVIAAQYGRGKTPLIAHLALEAACGLRLTPLGLVGCRPPVIVLDGESNSASHRAMLTRLTRAVGIEEWPGSLQLWFKLDPGLTAGTASADAVSSMVTERQPGLPVFDPLRQFASGYDLTDARQAVNFVETLRQLQAKARGLRITLTHHLTKRDMKRDHIALADDPWAWLERVAGSLALLDHADVRLGFEEENGKLVLAGIKHGVGIVGPWHFTLEEDAEGQPCRFRFEDQEHSIRDRYAHFLERLPDSFNWKAGRLILEIGESTMYRFVEAAKAVGMLVQGVDGVYRKVEVRK